MAGYAVDDTFWSAVLTEAQSYSLEHLRGAAEAAWLWDGVRARIVWANRPAIARFGGKSMFDLIDRPFDLAEPGIERIADLARNLPRGEMVEALLHFPSTGQTVPIHAVCMIHALIDGRAGVLVVEKPAIVEALVTVATAPLLDAAFDHLPMAAGLMDRDGGLVRLNGQAMRLMLPERRANLADVLGDAQVAQELQSRLLATATASLVQLIDTPFGQRDIRVTLQRLGDQADGNSLLLLDDVTERRALEQRLEDLMDAPPWVATPGDDVATFETIGQQVTTALEVEVAASAPVVAEAAIAAPIIAEHIATPVLRQPQALPGPLRDTLNKLSDALIITQDKAIVFANRAALELLGFGDVVGLINNEPTWELFSALGQSLPGVHVGNGVMATVAMTTLPWHGGPARQFLLRAIGTESPAAPILQRGAAQEPLNVVETATPEPLAPESFMGSQSAEPLALEDVVSRKLDSFAVVQASVEPVALQVPAASNVVKLPTQQQQAKSAIVADEEFRAILDTASDGIITLDRLGRIQTFSAEAIFGYRIAEVADHPLADYLTVESRKTLKEYLAALQGPGLARVLNDGRDVTAIVKQGGTVPLFLTIGVMPSRRSSAAFCAVLRDMTQWKRTEQDLRERAENAQTASRQKSEFLAHISHELRTPLNSILGFSEMMRMERFGSIENEKYRGYVNDIHTSGSHLLSLINDLLDLSKVEAGKLELNFTAVNIADVVDHAVRLLQDPATVARVVVRKAIAANLPNVVADLRSLRQVMLNLLSNAIKFTDPGGQVIISGSLTPGGGLSLRVKDTGIGMNASEIAAALEPFKRVETEGRATPGTGLGLPLTKALVEANRAGFTLTSEPRKGTQAEILFPTTRVLAE
jgi:PAS domain S-box-containing protein